MKNNKIVYSKWTFEDNDLKEGNLFIATSLLSSQLQVNTFEATVKCSDSSILNFERNAKLTYYYDGQQRGIFCVQAIERAGPDTYRISATSTLGLLTEDLHYGGIYTGQTAQEIIASICGSVPFIVKNNLAGTKLYGWLPIAPPRDNLSQVLFAIGAALKTDLDGVLRIAGLWDGISSAVGKDEMYQGGKVEYAAKVTQVALTEHQYSEGGDTKKLFEGTAQAGDIITFSGPMYSLSASGFSIQASGANWAKVSGGSGSLTGREYVHNTRLITRNVQTANTPNIKTVDKATLVSLVNSAAVADRLEAFYKCTQTIDAPVIYWGENTGNVISMYHPYDKSAVVSCLQSTDVTLSGTLKAQEKSLVGFVPLQISEAVISDQHMLITSSRTITLPDGVNNVRAVLIGGGNGGYSGKSGSPGSAGSGCTVSSPDTHAYSASGAGGQGGSGGSGGSGGAGGRVASFEIAESVKTISVSIGSGGSSGSSGGNTSITVNGKTYSSSSGSSSPSGYQDLVTGAVYATTGGSGSSGARGGNGNAPSTSDTSVSPVSGYSGSSLGGNSGGSGGSGSKSYGSDDKWIVATSGGGGGGAAYYANGGTGGNGSGTTAGSGGTGASGTRPSTPSTPGRGGTGGNGGGGGGGGGGTVAWAANYGTAKAYGGSAGSGGSGGPGGYGANGCVILYYGIQKKIPAGQFVDKNGKTFLDKISRKFVV